MRPTLITLALLAAACSSGEPKPAPTTVATTTTTATPATTTTQLPTTTAPGECSATPRAEPNPTRPVYRLRLDVRPSEQRVLGDVTVRFTPDLPVDKLVFRLWPNGPRLAAHGASLIVGAVQVDGRPAAATQPDPTSLVVTLGRTSRASAAIEASMPWELKLPGPNNDRIAQIGDTIRLGSFFPILSWEAGVGWAVEPPTTGFSEASTAPTADFDMSVTVPPGSDVLATGIPDEARVRWHASAVRDVALSIGHFRLAAAEARGVKITVGVASDLQDSAQTFANKVAAKLAQLSDVLGPYPWATFTLAITPGLRGGIEYPAHVMQGPGTIGRTTSHELAHMWFYGLVGNNQGRDPWLDEGLATYAEGRVEGSLASLRATPVPSDGKGHLASPMTYWDAHQSSYYRGVYAQGARAVASLGAVDRVDCALRLYVARNAHRIARPNDLIAAASAVFADAPTKLAAYGVTSTP